MYCKKCGKEIKEGNTFCTNCGEPINNIKENTTRTETNTNTDEKENNKSDKKVIKLKLWHIITITLICLALLIGVVVIFNNKNNSDKLQNVNNIVAQDTSKSNDKKYDVEIGKYYKYSLDNQYSSIMFNDTTGFIIKSGVVNSEENVETGTYQIEDNKITFTINYNSIYGDGEGISDEDVKIPYTKEMTILENGNIEYVTPYTTCLYVKEGSNTGTEEITSANLLETIYAKYPEMKEKDGFICTDGEQYWLLDKAGKKIYFHDLDSFDSALVKTYTSDDNANEHEIQTNSKNNDNNTSTSNSNSSKAEQLYSQIAKGMSYSEVRTILGEPKSKNNSKYTSTYIWVIDGSTITVHFQYDKVYQVLFGKNSAKNESNLDPETTHLISFATGFAIEDYTEKLDNWGIKYKVNKVQDLNYDNNVVTKIEPNNCYIDKNTIVTLSVSDNTYDMSVVVDTQYLVGLANITGKYSGDKIQLTLKINGQTIFNGTTDVLGMVHSLSLGNISGKSTGTYNVEATVDGVTITKKINYNIRCNSYTQRFEIYAGGDIGGG